MKQGALVLTLCALIVFAAFPPAGALAGTAGPRQVNTLWHDDFDGTGGLESLENLAPSSGYLQIPPLVQWIQDTFADFYPGAGAGVDLYARPGAVSLARFTPNRRVNDVMAGLQVQPAAAAGPKYLYAAWADGRGGDLDAYFSRSSDAGMSWESSRRLDSAPEGDAQRPALAALDEQVLAAWEGEEGIRLAASTDSGVTWSSDNLVALAGYRPSLAVGPGIVHLAYLVEETPGDPDVFYCRSTDGGFSWSVPEEVTAGEPDGAVQQDPHVVTAGPNLVWAAWQDGRGGDGDIYSAQRLYPDSWLAWQVDAGPTGSLQQQPVLFFPPGTIEPSCLWRDDRGGSDDLYWAEFQQSFWLERGALTGPGAGASGPAVAVAGTGVWAGWTAAASGPADTAWLSHYDGVSWEPAFVVADHLPGVTRAGLVLAPASAGTIAALWSDDRVDAGDVFATTSDGGFQPSGLYTSTVHTMGDLAAWGAVAWSGELTASIALQLRGGDTPAPDASWTAWLTATNGLTVPLPLGRYLQYRAVLRSSGHGEAPRLERVSISAVPRRGYGVSFPIGHCTAAWGSFDAAGYAPSGTTLTLSILDEAGQALYPDVGAPFDLSAVDPGAHPRLRLRVDQEGAGQITPLLDWWELSWEEGATRADLAFSPESVYTITAVAFTNLSTGPGEREYEWSFGDGVTSTLEGPTHTYSLPGSYTVTLAARGECGEDIASAELTVRPLPAASPRAAFAHGPLCAGQIVSFTNDSTGAVWWKWDLGDGEESALLEPTHAYTPAGDYTVTLSVTNTHGSDQAAELLAVRPAPSAALSWSDDFLAVSFTSTVSGDPGLLWSFGDGVTSTLANPAHTYSAAGSYTVTLRAENACAAVTTSAVVELSACAAPSNMEVSYSPARPAPGQAVALTATLGGGTLPVTYYWTFGDGAPPASGPAVTHTYAAAGAYTVTLAAWNGCGSAEVRVSVPVGAAVYRVYLPTVDLRSDHADPFEPDDGEGQARFLPLARPQRHTFAPEGDEDWLFLDLQAGATYWFETRDLAGGADTILTLYLDGAVVATDDDGCPALAACFEFTPDTTARYYLRVTQYLGGAQWGLGVGYTVEAEVGGQKAEADGPNLWQRGRESKVASVRRFPYTGDKNQPSLQSL